MLITGLLHVAIKTNDLDATVKFYTDVLGLKLAPRPDFGFPGAWIAVPTPVGEAIIHIYAGGPALGPEGRAPQGSAAIDHLSLSCSGRGPTSTDAALHSPTTRAGCVGGRGVRRER